VKNIEWIKNGDEVLGVIIPAEYEPRQTEFVTPDSYKQQAGFVVYPEKGRIIPHIHREMDRSIHGTSEVLFVRKGKCEVDFYLQDKTYFCTKIIKKDDILILVGGGHGFRMIEDTVFLEIKQGPYIGPKEKERFEPDSSPGI
jgi:cupin superfamily acireductone dioxygenase involved in methionine salvage